ncbi:uncharacterized protein LOC131689736 [Topomyia yanbarensis]|uniref:uncharacterized protein LOC131689736 n=1 Tax=Topomyia yanbarensis TaxID=2498891 RepID=UPI00273C50C4|nr:uncharacterized protein LOC131689736 [Topomyia yanbarensis]
MLKACVISDVVCVEAERDNPVLLNFQNAEMGYKDDNQIQCFRAVDTGRANDDDDAVDPDRQRHSRMAVVISEQQAYRGYLGEGLPTDQLNTYVAIRNKKTGKMRLIQLEECTMINSCYDDNRNKFADLGADKGQTAIRQFGGKHALRVLDRMARSGSNIDVMNETIEESVQKFDDEQFTEDNEFTKNKLEGELILASMKPPRNPAAVTPDELYRLEDMISEPVLKELNTVSLELLQKDPASLQLATVYLTNKVKAALQCKEPDSVENIRTIVICLVMDALSQLLDKHNRSLKNLQLSAFSKQLNREIKSNFSQINHHKQLKTKYTEHKALTYYLALAFALEGCVLNVDQIHTGLGIPRNDLLKFAAFIGGTYNSAKNTLTLRMGGGDGSFSGGRSFLGKRRFGRKK